MKNETTAEPKVGSRLDCSVFKCRYCGKKLDEKTFAKDHFGETGFCGYEHFAYWRLDQPNENCDSEERSDHDKTM